MGTMRTAPAAADHGVPDPAARALAIATGALALLALVTALIAFGLSASASAWLSFLGAPLGILALLMALLTIWLRRREGRRSITGPVAAVLGAVAIALLPLHLWACGSLPSCGP